MPEHLSEQDIQRYHSRGLPPSERLRLSDHIAQCETCRHQARAANPRPFDLAAFRSEFRVPTGETFPGDTRAAPPAWWKRLLAPCVLAPAFGAAMLLVIALAAQNALLRREYSALARHANLISRPVAKPEIAVRGHDSRSDGFAAKPDRHQQRARTPQNPMERFAPQMARTTPPTKPKHAKRQAVARLPKTPIQQPTVVRASGVGTSALANIRLDPNLLAENRLATAALSPDERRLLFSAENSDMRGDETGNGNGQARPVEIISPTGPMIIAPLRELRWKGFEGAALYKVYLSEVVRLDTNLVGNKELNWFKAEQAVTDTTLSIDHALAPGKVYQWDVSAFADKEGNKLLARASLKFLVADPQREKLLESIAQSQFTFGQMLEQNHQWERAASQYRAIDPAAAKTFHKAQERLTRLEQKQRVQP